MYSRRNAGRSRTIIMVVIGIMSLLLAACAGGNGDGEGAQSPSPTDTADATETPAGTASPTDPDTEPSGESQEVLLAIPAPSLNFVPYMMAMDRDLGFYEDQGIDLTVDIIRGDAALAGLLEGSVHFTAAGGTAMRAAINGAPVRAVMMTAGQTTFSVVATDEITEIADLEGRTVGLVGSGLADTTGVALRAVLESEGLDAEQDIEVFVAPTPPDILAALLGGSIDAAVLAPPQSQVAVSEGFNEVAQAWDYVELTQGQIATSVEMIESDPELVKAFIAGSLDAINYAIDNEQETVDYIVERFELDESVAQASYDILQEAYLSDGRPSDEAALGELPEGSTQEDLARTVDFSLLEEVLASR